MMFEMEFGIRHQRIVNWIRNRNGRQLDTNNYNFL
jgi:hypothetical protein